MINADGERFVDEGADFRNFTYAKYGAVILRQPGQFAWQIFDSKVTAMLRGEYRIKRITKTSADTLEELVSKLEGVNAPRALETLKAFNAAVMSEKPFDPNVKDGRGTRGLSVPKSNWANPLDAPPYEAYAVTCGVTFTFGGVVYNQVRIYSNGSLAFNDTSGYWRDYTNTTLPITTASGMTVSGCTDAAPARFMSVYWLDIVAGTANSTSGASIKYELLGTAPNRRLVISWVNVKLYNQTARYNFQVALYESPGGSINSNFKFQYTTGSATGTGATVGVQLTTSDYTLYSYNQAFIDPTTGSAILWYPANQSVAKGAEYRFDEGTWNGTAGEVKDTSGGSSHGVKVGAASSTSNGKICRGGDFTGNNSTTTIDGVSIPITPANVGSVDLWYKSNSAWTANDAMLIDATSVATRPFFFMRTSSGTLKFSVSDAAGTVLTATSAAQSFAASTWHHVGVSWNLRPGTNQSLLQIFLDGVLLTTARGTTTGSITSKKFTRAPDAYLLSCSLLPVQKPLPPDDTVKPACPGGAPMTS